FEEQIKRFRFIEDVKVVRTSLENLYIPSHPHDFPTVKIAIKVEGVVSTIFLQDRATGISSDTLSNSLLIPTSSTKGIDSARDIAPSVNVAIIQDGDNKGLILAVGRVVVTNIKFDTDTVAYV